MSTHHQTLGLQKGASQDEIRDAYRTLARLHHPDRGGDAETFNRIARAYKALKVCPECEGTGTVRVRRGAVIKTQECPLCTA